MKILAASDLHGDKDVAVSLANKAIENNVDLIILAGDLTLSDNLNKYMLKPLKDTGKKILILSGNHDSPATIDFLAEYYKLHKIENTYYIHENIGIIGRGGANIGPFALEEQKIFEDIKANHEKIKNLDKKILVTHVHPSGTLAEKMTNVFPGSTGIKKAIEELQPDIAICGHVHEAEGLEEQIGKTRIINVGEKGKIIEF
jgi:putative phosphoesterase